MKPTVVLPAARAPRAPAASASAPAPAAPRKCRRVVVKVMVAFPSRTGPRPARRPRRRRAPGRAGRGGAVWRGQGRDWRGLSSFAPSAGCPGNAGRRRRALGAGGDGFWPLDAAALLAVSGPRSRRLAPVRRAVKYIEIFISAFCVISRGCGQNKAGGSRRGGGRRRRAQPDRRAPRTKRRRRTRGRPRQKGPRSATATSR